MSDKIIHIALVDDHTLIRKGLIELIQSFPKMEVVFDASTGEEFVQKLEKARRKPDVCLLDINMPGMNGFETLDVIRQRWPEQKVLAVSMHLNEFSIIKMLQKGANGYMAKMEEPHELYKAIVDVYFTGYYHSNAISPRILHLLLNNKKEALPRLTDEDLKFLALCSTELTYKEIADKMNVSSRSIEAHRSALFEKLNVKSRVGLVLYALRIGLITIN